MLLFVDLVFWSVVKFVSSLRNMKEEGGHLDLCTLISIIDWRTQKDLT